MNKKNVYDLIQERLNVIFKEFDNVYISFSGEKTVEYY
ncbi:phosphoadenosine phosphosulfate reductase [Bacteroides eggerthii]|uniref:Phosphoadenosine phosphosulfate reductase n=1 Tax=Bacteroides eggerthii TaxID=28111 RepID=A0A380YGT6_9BACE|nr:phosphoadenosine phosphosulfate reductase [Bacteroides eggerthii]